MSGIVRQEGVASWYGAEFAGHPTASGEIFDPDKLTAAHADLPFGTYLIVTNTVNDKKIAVRVNDRGPFVKSRILDISRAAAERLDMLATGTARVILEVTTPETAAALVRSLGVATPTAQPAAPLDAPAAARAPATTPAVTAGTATTAPSSTTASRASASTAPRTTVQPVSAGTAVTTTRGTSPAASPVRTTSGAASATVPAMTATAPRTPPASSQAQLPTSAPVIAPVPVTSTPSVSRVTGNVENIPEIRHPPTEPNFVPQEPALPSNLPLAQTRQAIAQQNVTTTSGILLPAEAPDLPPPVSAASGAPVNTANAASTVNTANAVSAANVASDTRANQGPSVSMPPALPPENNAAQPAQSATGADSAPAGTAAVPAATPVTTAAAPPPAAPEGTAAPPASVPITRDPSLVELEGSPVVPGKSYRIQVGSFTKASNAVEVFDRLSSNGLSPSYERYNEYYRVVITNVRGEDMPSVSQKLAVSGITKALAREEVPQR
jgi:rare lipoprotein A (peptidoglycan hydrolase)